MSIDSIAQTLDRFDRMLKEKQILHFIHRSFVRSMYFECVFRQSQRNFMFIPKSIWFNDVDMFNLVGKLFLNEIFDLRSSVLAIRTDELGEL